MLKYSMTSVREVIRLFTGASDHAPSHFLTNHRNNISACWVNSCWQFRRHQDFIVLDFSAYTLIFFMLMFEQYTATQACLHIPLEKPQMSLHEKLWCLKHTAVTAYIESLQ